MEPVSTRGASAPVAHVILVHGIGEISPGGVLEAAAAGIKGTLPGVHVSEVSRAERVPVEDLTILTRSMPLCWQHSHFTLSEFHWADEAQKMQWSKRPADAVRKFMQTLGEVPSLGLQADSAPWVKKCAGVLMRTMRGTAFCLVAGTLAMVLMFLVLIGLETFYGPDITLKPPGWLSMTVKVLTMFFGIGIATLFFVAVGSWSVVGGRFILERVVPGFQPKSRVALATGIAALMLAAATPFLLLMVMLTGMSFGVGESVGRWLRRLWFGWGDLLGQASTLEAATVYESTTTLAAILVLSYFILRGCAWLYRQLAVISNLLRDMSHYLAADERGEPERVQGLLQGALWWLIERCRAESPAARIVLVAHSLGTVIATDTLLSQRRLDPTADCMVDLVTAGSPLRRLIHRLMPHRAAEPLETRAMLAATSGVRVERWFNCFRSLDLVGTALSDRPSTARTGGWGDAARSILERPLARQRGLPNGHGNYWKDPRFIAVISAEVIAPLVATATAAAGVRPAASQVDRTAA